MLTHIEDFRQSVDLLQAQRRLHYDCPSPPHSHLEKKDTIAQLTEKIKSKMAENPDLANNPRFSGLFTEKRRGQGSKRAATAYDLSQQDTSTPQARPSRAAALPDFSHYHDTQFSYNSAFPSPGSSAGPSSSRSPYSAHPSPPISAWPSNHFHGSLLMHPPLQQ